MVRNKCVDCAFYRPHINTYYNTATGYGECRRSSPRLVRYVEHRAEAVFPEVYDATWCGNFRHKPEAK